MLLRFCIFLVVGSFVKCISAEGVAYISYPLSSVRIPRSLKNENLSGTSLEMSVEDNPNQCLCEKSECGCCFHLDVPEIKLNISGCIEVGYLSEDIGVTIGFTLGGRTLLNSTISVKDPPPLCIAIPFLKEYCHVCLEFYNVDFSSKHYAACAKIDVAIWPFCAIPVELGCFNINGKGPNAADRERLQRTMNITGGLEDAKNEQWRKSRYPWKYSVCSSNSIYASSYSQVALVNALLLCFLYFSRKFQE